MIVHKRGNGLKPKRKMHHLSKNYIKGDGILDIFKPIVNLVKTVATTPGLAEKVGKTASDVFAIGKNTRDIINSIKESKKSIPIPEINSEVEEIINKIKRIRTGNGFAYI
jgi:heterodisulfide reductase subunit C